ncbi:MAG: glycoside hydrolase family 17 protein [Planctomycetota bacterium]|jgi:exo-beta-1,3-glucanase (GH17 family)
MAMPAVVRAGDGAAVSQAWRQRVVSINWTAYSPPTANPDRGVRATPEAIRADFAVLRSAGFNGAITYGSSENYANAVLAAARAEGFKGLILGVWDPGNAAELAAAGSVGSNKLVLGYCVGNEGYQRRYDRATLLKAIDELRQATGKPVTTSEELDDYLEPEVVAMGDWVFPNAHPFFHGRFDAAAAARWTYGAYDELSRRSKRFVWFKEVGLPTAGDDARPLSEAAQDEYYTRLAASRTWFAYFEAFDQPWKNPGTVEPFWGMFRADRSPKQMAKRLIAEGLPPCPPNLAHGPPEPVDSAKGETATRKPLYVYLDGDSPQNHFSPTGRDGDCGDIKIDYHYHKNPRSRSSCIKVDYLAKGQGPNLCAYAPPCKWAAMGWQHPAKNDGKQPRFKDKGLDLTGYRRLTFWARADSPCRVRFLVGGIDEPYGDTLTYPRGSLIDLEPEWRQYEIDLAGADLGHMISGFGWAANWDLNPKGMTFYIDEVRFE